MQCDVPHPGAGWEECNAEGSGRGSTQSHQPVVALAQLLVEALRVDSERLRKGLFDRVDEVIGRRLSELQQAGPKGVRMNRRTPFLLPLNVDAPGSSALGGPQGRRRPWSRRQSTHSCEVGRTGSCNHAPPLPQPSLCTPSCFEDGDAEGLGERAVEEDVAAREDVAHVLVRDGAEQLDAVVELVALAHLLKQQLLRAVAADDEVDVRVALADRGDDVDDEVDALHARVGGGLGRGGKGGDRPAPRHAFR